MDPNLSHQTEEYEDTLVIDSTGTTSQLIIFNDDFNTFDWVIKCLVEVCNHALEQAEQLSLIIHYKGKAIVKTDSFDILRPMKDALIERGLSAVIQTELQNK